MWSCGCFYGTGKELIEKAYKDSELSGQEYERIVNYVESIKSKLDMIDAAKMTPSENTQKDLIDRKSAD